MLYPLSYGRKLLSENCVVVTPIFRTVTIPEHNPTTTAFPDKPADLVDAVPPRA